VSSKFPLWVTPPDIFFSIWGLIYTLVTVILYWSCSKNNWSPKSHIYFWLVNLSNSAWIYIWCQGSKAMLVYSLYVIVALLVFLLLWWRSFYTVSAVDSSYFITRNTVALYAGWLVGATMLNLGMVLVHSINKFSQKQYAQLFFVACPLILIVAQIVIRIKEGAHGTKSSWGMILSVLWALSGAWLTASAHKSDLFSKGLFDL
jgi:hypothetical protein